MGGPPLLEFGLPPIPRLDPTVVEANEHAHAALADDLEAVGELTRRAFRFVQWRILRESVASVEPPLAAGIDPLVPARRRHLSRARRLRLDGCTAALRHLDSRVAMQRMGAIPHVIAPETPMVLHAFVEAGDPHGKRSNAGSVRATPSAFVKGESDYLPPPASRCRPLLLDAIEMANDAPAPPITRASWLVAVLFAVHPFVDGNGRTGRLLFHGLASEHSPCGIDWGTMAEIATDRSGYIAATRAVVDPSLPTYDARRLEPVHLMNYLATRSTAGTERTRRRLAVIDAVLDRLGDGGLDDDGALVTLAVAADRNGRLSDLDDLLDDRPTTTRVVNALVAEGWLRWDRAGRLQPVGQNPFRPA